MSETTDRTREYRVPNELAREYLARNEGVTLTPSTTCSYDSYLTEYVSFLHGRDRSVLAAEFNDVLDFIDSCVRSGNRQSTIESKASTISELYRYIRLRTESGDDLQLDPLRFREIDFDNYNTPEEIKREALTREEIRRLFDAFDSYRDRLMTIVGVETGMRNSDIRNIRLEDLQEGIIHVPNPKNAKPYDVPISEQLEFELDLWKKHHRTGYPTARKCDYLFLSQHGGKLKQNDSFGMKIKEAAERANIQEVIGRSRITETEQNSLDTDKEYREWHRVTPHTLRHTFITLLKDSGVSLSYRMLVANHSSAETNLRYTSGETDIFDPIRSKFEPPR